LCLCRNGRRGRATDAYKHPQAAAPPEKSTSQSTENARDTPGCGLLFFSLAPRISRAYKQFVSSWSSGGLHESTGLRSARQLSTPLLRCESRTNRLKANPLAKRRSKRKKRALNEGPLCFCSHSVQICRLVRRGLSMIFPNESECRLGRGYWVG